MLDRLTSAKKQYKRGQSTLDYVILFTIIIAVLLVMGYYIRNAIQGKFREAADTIGQGETYSPDVDGTRSPTSISGSVRNQ